MGALFLAICNNPNTSQSEKAIPTDTIISTLFQQDTTSSCSKPKVRVKKKVKEKTKTDTIKEELKTIQIFDIEMARIDPPVETPDTTIPKEETYPIILGMIDINPKVIDGDTIYSGFIEVMPEFIGGIDSLQHFMEENLEYPKWEEKKKIEGVVIVQFIVDKNGKVKNPSIIKSATKNLDREVLRVVDSMPDWTPGKQDGKNVNFQFTLPIKFEL